MSIQEGQTMAVGHGRRAHRGLWITKVENGYEIHAAFEVLGGKANHPGAEINPHPMIVDKTYVFYTEEEVVGFVLNYLQADKAELRET